MTAVGGHGAPVQPAASTGAGGAGDTVTTSLSVTPGEVLYVEVGGNGASGIGGFNGGGGSLNVQGEPAPPYGGGGASDVRTCSMATCSLTADDSRLVVAGGGGGGANAETWGGPPTGTSTPSTGSAPGPSGGGAGEPQGAAGGDAAELPRALFPFGPAAPAATGGGGGTQTSGGAAGTSTAEPPGDVEPQPGSLGQGGSTGGGGAGGGGYWGGGAGVDTGEVTGYRSSETGDGASAGGGGSDHVDLTAVPAGSNPSYGPSGTAGVPQVTISWDGPSAALPEARDAVLLPVLAAAGLGGFALRRRRRTA